MASQRCGCFKKEKKNSLYRAFVMISHLAKTTPERKFSFMLIKHSDLNFSQLFRNPGHAKVFHWHWWEHKLLPGISPQALLRGIRLTHLGLLACSPSGGLCILDLTLSMLSPPSLLRFHHLMLPAPNLPGQWSLWVISSASIKLHWLSHCYRSFKANPLLL